MCSVLGAHRDRGRRGGQGRGGGGPEEEEDEEEEEERRMRTVLRARWRAGAAARGGGRAQGRRRDTILTSRVFCALQISLAPKSKSSSPDYITALQYSSTSIALRVYPPVYHSSTSTSVPVPARYSILYSIQYSTRTVLYSSLPERVLYCTVRMCVCACVWYSNVACELEYEVCSGTRLLRMLQYSRVLYRLV